jgi:ankyrin repeat protein
VRRLLNEGAEVNGITNDISPLRAASCAGQVAAVKVLLEYGADPNTPSDKPITGLLCALFRGHDEVAKVLIRTGARINDAIGKRRVTALMVASQSGHAHLVKMLLESGADPNQIDDWGGSALYRAAYVGSSDIVRMLVEAGANTTVKLSNSPEQDRDVFPGDTPLAIAKRKGFTTIVEYLERERGKE